MSDDINTDTTGVDLTALTDRQLLMKTHTVCMEMKHELAPDPLKFPEKRGLIHRMSEAETRLDEVDERDKKQDDNIKEAATMAAAEAGLSATEKYGAIGAIMAAIMAAIGSWFKGGGS